jgi:hypothetical protein
LRGWGRLTLLLLGFGLPPLGLQLMAPVPRLDADAVEYFSHVRSLYFDQDLDFANEFAHFGILTRGDKVRPTVTGHRRTIFSVGPALLWMPFYAAGDVVARFAGDREDGYSPYHIRAVCLASLGYGLVGLLLVYRILQALYGESVATWAAALLLYATFLVWYMVHEAAMSHALSFFASALVLAAWWPGRRRLGSGRAALLGLLIGVGATVRWQNAVLLLLPAASLLLAFAGFEAVSSTGDGRSAARSRASVVSRALPVIRRELVVLATFVLGAAPQMLAWKAIFGEYLLEDPPHGKDFLRLDHPYLLNTFFSSRHGLLYWTPVLWGGFLGFLAFFRRDRFTALALGLPLVVMSYVNACSGDWWAGGSFSNRRFDSVLPLLAVGLGATLFSFVEAVRRRPLRLAWALGLGFVVWNQLFILQYRQARLPQDDTVSFTAVVEGNAEMLGRLVGTPLAWPANGVFAAELDLPPARYDLAVGKYLFYRQNNLGGLIKMGDGRSDPALLAGGWSARTPCGEATCRRILGRARVLAPLDVPEDLNVLVRAEGRGTLEMAVNGRLVAAFPLEDALRGLRAKAPRTLWRREMNDVSLVLSPGGAALVERIVFERAVGPGSGGQIR